MDKQITINDYYHKIAMVAEALANPTRVAILDYIITHKTCFCKDLTNHLPLVQSTISQHLKKLKTAGLIIGQQNGKSTCYCVNVDNLRQFKQLFNEIFTDEKLTFACC